MVEFALPKNSKITGGKAWPMPSGATETREFRVYRWNPDDGKNPSVDTYHVDTGDCGPSPSMTPPRAKYPDSITFKPCEAAAFSSACGFLASAAIASARAIAS